jgi:metallo-beta-lactamase family protein
VRLFGEEIDVNANIYTINGFSAHADRAELIAWHKQLQAEHTVLVHGEEEVMRIFASKLKNTEVLIPAKNQSFSLPTLKEI